MQPLHQSRFTRMLKGLQNLYNFKYGHTMHQLLLRAVGVKSDDPRPF